MAHIHTLSPLERLEKTPRSLSPLLNTPEPSEDHPPQHSIRHFYNKMSSGPHMDLPMIHTSFTSYKCASPNSPAINYQNRAFSTPTITSRASTSSLHTQYSSSSDRSLSSSPGPSTPSDMLSRSPLLGHDRPVQKPTLPSLHHKHSLGSLQYRPHSPYPPTRQRELEHPRRHSHPHVPTANTPPPPSQQQQQQQQQLPPLPAPSQQHQQHHHHHHHHHLPLPQRSFSHDEPQEEQQYRHHDQEYSSMHYPHHRQSSDYDRSTPMPTAATSSSTLSQPMSAARSPYSQPSSAPSQPSRYHPYDVAPLTPGADHSHQHHHHHHSAYQQQQQHSRYPAESPIDRSSSPATDYFHSRHSMASPMVSSPTGSASPSPMPAGGFAYHHHHHHLPSPSSPLSDSTALRPLTPPPARSRNMLLGGNQSIIRRQSEPDFHARGGDQRPSSLIRHPVELVHRPLSRLQHPTMHHPSPRTGENHHHHHLHHHGSDQDDEEQEQEQEEEEEEEDDVMEMGHRRQVPALAHPRHHHLPFHLQQQQQQQQQQDRDHDLDLVDRRPLSAEPMSMSRSPSPGLYGSMSSAVTGSSMSLASLTSSTSSSTTLSGPSMPSTPGGLVRSHSSMSIKSDYGVVMNSPLSTSTTPLAKSMVPSSNGGSGSATPTPATTTATSCNTQLLLCPVCSRAFKPSKNQNCNLRRHLKNVHNMSPTMHPRKCKWDSLPDGRVKDDKDRKERTRKSKRLWARKFRQRRKVEEAAVVLSMLREAI